VIGDWANASLLEMAFSLLLWSVSAVASVKVAMLAWHLFLRTSWWTVPIPSTAHRRESLRALRDAEQRFLWLWNRCDALVRSTRALLCLTVILTAWFAAFNWFDLMNGAYGDAYPRRPISTALVITAARLGTSLTAPLGVATMLCLAWITCDGLLRRRCLAWERAVAIARHELGRGTLAGDTGGGE
jgi:hypothetical protein